jgi:hypothetical protein
VVLVTQATRPLLQVSSLPVDLRARNIRAVAVAEAGTAVVVEQGIVVAVVAQVMSRS